MSQKRNGMLPLWFALSIPLLLPGIPSAWAETLTGDEVPVAEEGSAPSEVLPVEFMPTYRRHTQAIGRQLHDAPARYRG